MKEWGLCDQHYVISKYIGKLLNDYVVNKLGDSQDL